MYSKTDADKLCESIYKAVCEDWDKLEKERLNKIFAALGSVETHFHLAFPKAETLETVRNGVESGDRKAMLELLAILTDSLRMLEILPREVRLAFADGLDKMRDNLGEAKGFLPRKRGERSKKEKHDREYRVFFTAVRVEYYRVNLGLSLDKAEAKVAEEFFMQQDLVHKYWQQAHYEAKQQIEMMGSILKLTDVDQHIRRKKKVR